MKPGRRLCFIFTLALIWTAGCSSGGEMLSPARAAVETHVAANGDAERRVVVDASPPGPSFELSGRWSLSAGVDVADRSAAAGRSYELSGVNSDGLSGGMSLQTGDHFFWRDFEFVDRLEGPLSQSRRFTGGVGYKLVMPGRISAAPGAARTSGDVAIYDINADESPVVRAESWTVRWWAVLGTAGSLFAVTALILGGRAARAVRSIPRWLWTGKWS